MVKIDAMFFTATEEPCTLLGQKGVPNPDIEKNKEKEDDYLEYDTFILCNPNAMSY